MPEIVLLRLGDIDELRTLLRRCWLDTYTGIIPDSVIRKAIDVWQSRETLQRGIENPSAYYAGFLVEGKLAGMVSAAKTDRDTLRIFQLYVLPEHQRKGIGRRLMDSAIEKFPDARKVVLEVEESNEKGVSFYAKYGFRYPGRTVVKIDGNEIPCLVGELELA